MRTTEISSVLAGLFAELADGASQKGGAFILNSRDIGLLRSLNKLSAVAAGERRDGVAYGGRRKGRSGSAWITERRENLAARESPRGP